MKKEIWKTVKNGVIMGTVALIIICAGFYIFIKARSTTNPGLAEQSPIGGLYVNNGDTLNAAKRNTLVNKVNSGVNMNDCILSGKNFTNTANTRSAVSLTCPTDYPYLIDGTCNWNREINTVFRGKYDTTNLNKRTCNFRDPTSHTMTTAIQIKCCK